MSAATLAPGTLDVSGTPRIPLSRLVRVELRKLCLLYTSPSPRD